MRIVFLGSPGIGKGTQASLLAQRRGLSHISTGVIIRAAIEAETQVGRVAEEYVQNGRLVPDKIMRELADTAIAQAEYDQFVLDGYPRTIVQAEWLTESLSSHEASLDAAISLVVPTDVIVDRLSKRRVNKLTGENYHLDFKPPPPDLDPDQIIQREDDKPEYIRKRLDVYAEESEPVVAYYRERELLIEVDGVGPIEEVYARIEDVLAVAHLEKKPT